MLHQPKLPEGFELQLNVYLTSDSTGVNIVSSLIGLPFVPDLEAPNVKELAKILQADLPNTADDWRLMTAAEIKAYKTEEKEIEG